MTPDAPVHPAEIHPSEVLSADDSIALVRAVSHAAEVTDARLRVIAAISEFSRIIDADMGTAVETFIDPQTGEVSVSEMIFCGDMPDESRDAYVEYVRSGRHNEDPLLAAVGQAAIQLRPQDPIVIHARQDLVPDEAWYGLDFFEKTHRPLGVDACIYAGLRGNGPGVWVGSGFHRLLSRPQFTRREVELARCFLLGAKPLFTSFVASPKQAAVFLGNLSRGQRSLVMAILDGLSGKQIASRLGVTESSVHTYCKRLYAALEVSGRAELTRLCHEKGVFPAPARR